MNLTEQQIKHLEFIQSIISRMNTNSFQLKGWTVALISALLALFASVKNEHFVLVAIVPAVLMWFLDSYYLMQERRFRGLYSDIVGATEESEELKPFEMRTNQYTGWNYSFCRSFLSLTAAGLYIPIIVGLVVLFFVITNC